MKREKNTYVVADYNKHIFDVVRMQGDGRAPEFISQFDSIAEAKRNLLGCVNLKVYKLVEVKK